MPAELEHVRTALAAIDGEHNYSRRGKFQRKRSIVFSADRDAIEDADCNLFDAAYVTARNTAELALRAAEERMRFTLERLAS